jgi:hypothetical protein
MSSTYANILKYQKASMDTVRWVIHLSQWFIILCLWLYCIPVGKEMNYRETLVYKLKLQYFAFSVNCLSPRFIMLCLWLYYKYHNYVMFEYEIWQYFLFIFSKPNVWLRHTNVEYDAAFPMTTGYCQLLTVAQYETQATTETEKALKVSIIYLQFWYVCSRLSYGWQAFKL